MEHFPVATQHRMYFVQFLTEVGTASCKGSTIYPFYRRCDNMAIDFEDLLDVPEEYISIDSKVARNYINLSMKTIKDHGSPHYSLASDILQNAERYVKMEPPSSLKGIQCMRLIRKHTETEENRGFMFDITEIEKPGVALKAKYHAIFTAIDCFSGYCWLLGDDGRLPHGTCFLDLAGFPTVIRSDNAGVFVGEIVTSSTWWGRRTTLSRREGLSGCIGR